MSGPKNPELALRLLDEVQELMFLSDMAQQKLVSLFYMVAAVVGGNWCDFEPEGTAGGEIHEVIGSLPCRPLLAPYLEPRVWPDDEITALRVAHRLTS